jgi:hypothetical protein
VKRDHDYLRELLFNAEADEDRLILVPHETSGDRRLEHHVDLLCDAGLFAQISESGFRLTNEGHDYLDAIRDDTNWKRTKKMAEKVGGVGLVLMRDIAVGYVKQQITEKLSISLG